MATRTLQGQLVVGSTLITMLAMSAVRTPAQDTLRVVPSPAEIQEQTQRSAELDSLRADFLRQQERMRVLEQQLASLQGSATIERQRLAAEQQNAARAAAAQERDLRIATISGWANSVRSLRTGLRTAAGISEVGNLTLVYRPSDAKSISGILDLLGKAVTVGGAAIAGTDGERRGSGITVAAAGLGLSYLVEVGRNYFGSSNPRVRLYVERAAMHKTFATEVEALKISLSSVVPLVDTLSVTADSLVTANTSAPSRYASFQVRNQLVSDYRRLIESYSILVSQLQHTNSLATRLLQEKLPDGKPMNWSAEIRQNLQQTQDQTAEAIRAWRREIIVSEGLLENLQSLAAIDARTH